MIPAFFAWPSLVDHVWKMNAQAALMAVIVGVVCLVAKRWISAGWRSVLWMLVFARLIIPFGPASMFSLGNIVSSPIATHPTTTNRVEATHPNLETMPVRPVLPMEIERQVATPGSEAPLTNSK